MDICSVAQCSRAEIFNSCCAHSKFDVTKNYVKIPIEQIKNLQSRKLLRFLVQKYTLKYALQIKLTPMLEGDPERLVLFEIP